MPNGVSDSQFNKWRAIVALAHVDGQVPPEEREFVLSRLEKVPFSAEQRETLVRELDEARDLNEFYPLITEDRDRGELIHFARLLFWSDGVLEVEEEEILKYLKEDVVDRLEFDTIMQQADTAIRAEIQDHNLKIEELRNKRSWGLASFIDYLLTRFEDSQERKEDAERVDVVDFEFDELEALTPSRFEMWRAIVALVHADHQVTQNEKDFVRKYYDMVAFTDAQKEILEAELETAQDINTIFPGITDEIDRGDFIHFARLLFWADGDFGQQEEKLLEVLNEEVISKIDLGHLMHEVDVAIDEARAQRAQEWEEDTEKAKDLTCVFRLMSNRFGKR